MNPSKENLSFFNHLEELRIRLIKSLLAFSLAAVVSYNFAGDFLKFLINPVQGVVFISPIEGFIATLTATFLLGVIISAPFILYQIWAFISDALTESERKYVRIFGPSSFILFFSGILFGYFVIVPISLKFFLSFATAWMIPVIRVSEYISFVVNIILAFGVVFELPLLIVFLSKIRITSPEFLRQKRRYAIVSIFIISAILTPPDCASQLLMAIPLIVLYELGIILSNLTYQERI